MVDIGDTAPEFTLPLADSGDIEPFTLSAHLEEAPLVLAFFPGAFSGTCIHEMETFRDRIAAFDEAGATLYGVSTDLPWSLAEFREAHGLPFGLLSDADGDVVEAYGVATAFEGMALRGIAQRAVFVVDADGEVTYRWVADDAGVEPDYEEVLAAAEAAGR